MSIFEIAMSHDVLKRKILIEFGFGEVSPKEVEKWIRHTYPLIYKELKRQKSGNLIELKAETMTREQRSEILDSFENNMKTKEEK